jgi:biopolymer transport protein ExbD
LKLGRVKAIPEAGFDLTPMIDVVLLLIIFFVLSAQFAQAVRKPLDLPAEPGVREGDVGPTTLLLDIDRAGDMFTGGTRIDLEGLRVTMKSHIKHVGSADNVETIIRADRATPAVHLNKVARVLSELGIRNWKLATAGDGSPP